MASRATEFDAHMNEPDADFAGSELPDPADMFSAADIAEIERRIAEYEAGITKLEPIEVAYRRIKAALNANRM